MLEAKAEAKEMKIVKEGNSWWQVMAMKIA